MSDERRRFSRVRFQSSCHVTLGERRFEVSLADISLRGALIESNEKLPAQKGDSCQFELNLGSTGTILIFDAELVYYSGKQFGIRFSDISLENMIHLRRLVELNIGDSDKVQNELFFLITSC